MQDEKVVITLDGKQVQEPDTFRDRIHGQIMKLLSDE